MAEDYERLQRQIEEGLRAVRELKKMAAQQKREERPKLKLLRGGLLGGALWAGVEWLRSYKLGVAIAATAVTIGGGVIAEHPGSPSADPPAQSVTQSAAPRTSVPPTPTPRSVVPSPRRTSPPRTYARVAPAEPTRLKSTETPKAKVPHVTKPPKVKIPKVLPRLPVKTPRVTPSIPVVVETPECTIGLLGLCILG